MKLIFFVTTIIVQQLVVLISQIKKVHQKIGITKCVIKYCDSITVLLVCGLISCSSSLYINYHTRKVLASLSLDATSVCLISTLYLLLADGEHDCNATVAVKCSKKHCRHLSSNLHMYILNFNSSFTSENVILSIIPKNAT